MYENRNVVPFVCKNWNTKDNKQYVLLTYLMVVETLTSHENVLSYVSTDKQISVQLILRYSVFKVPVIISLSRFSTIFISLVCLGGTYCSK